MSIQVAVLVGSLRKDSYNLKVAKAIEAVSPHDFSFKLIKIDDLPYYNEDEDGATTFDSYKRLRAEIKESQAVLFVMPEYNRSFPAVIKNAIDVGSRPYGQSVWAGKPAAVVTASQGNIGGFGSNNQLRQCFVFLDLLPLQQPEMYLSHIQNSFDAQGNIDPKLADHLKDFMVQFENLVRKVNS